MLTGGIFLTARNLFNLSLQVAVVGIMTCGMVLVIVVAPHRPLGRLAARLHRRLRRRCCRPAMLPIDGGDTWWVTCLAMLAAGALIGLLQGALIAYAGIPSFVVTLGGLLFFRNAAYQINEGRTISPLNETFQLLGGGLNGTIGAFWSWIVGARRDRRDRRWSCCAAASAGAATASPSAPLVLDDHPGRRLERSSSSASSW